MNGKAGSSERNVLFESRLFEVVSILWTNKSTTPLHDHGGSQCFVLVLEGKFENVLDFGNKREVSTFESGQTFSIPVGTKHETQCLTLTGKTLHVYTPKLAQETVKLKFNSENSEELKNKLHLSQATPFEELKDLLDVMKKESISSGSPYFMNQLFSGSFPQMLMAEEFIAATKTTLATFEASPVLSAVENEVIEELSCLIGWEKRSGIAVPGGSAANFMAVHCARQNLFPKTKREGLDGRNLCVFVSAEAHYSFKKACAVLGLGMDNVISVPVDHKGRMKPEALDGLIQKVRDQSKVPLMVSATFGTTVLGAFDQVDELSRICKKHKIWLHVDGAWGGPALFSKKLRHLACGIENADSMTFDAHKLLGANLTSSFFLTKHPQILLEANDVADGDYLFHSDDPALDRGKLSWQCGRKAEAMSFWTIWKSMGTEGIGEFIDGLIGLRDEITAWIKMHPRLELIHMPDYLNVCVRVLSLDGAKDPEWSKIVRERLKEKNLVFVNYSSDTNGTFLRLILANPFLNFSHLEQILRWALEET